MNLPDIGMSDPNSTSPLEIAGGGPFKGKSVPDYGQFKGSKTDRSGESYQGQQGYGFMTNDASMKIQGNAPSGQNSSGIPAAKPITPMTYGDPNDSAVDSKDGFSPTGIDTERYGF